jgi:hypothetical protein
MPRVPNAGQAYVDPRKITEYLLSTSHPRGSDKAAFFARFGFSVQHWTTLRDALIDHLLCNNFSSAASDRFGQTFKVLGTLKSPDGRNPRVLVTWIVLKGESIPRLVTAVPGKDRDR